MKTKKRKKSIYQALLSHPLWQKMRLRVLERDGFKCRHCGCDYKTLQVHHLKYLRGRAPWQYPMRLLITLCDDCHERMHGIKARKRAAVKRAFEKARKIGGRK